MRPDSVFLAAIGTMWEPLSWARVMDMFVHTRQEGFGCWFEEMLDMRTDNPDDAVASMRNRAIVRARNAGAEYVCLVENDVLPEPDTLIKLMKVGTAVTIPYMCDYDKGYPLMGPEYPRDNGVLWLRWSVFSFMLFRVNALTGLGMTPFANGAGEGDFWDQLWAYGHAPVVDTHTEVKLARYPSRTGSKSPDELAAFRLDMEQKRGQTPDRGPVDPNDERVLDGIYSPWMFPAPESEPAELVNGKVEA